MNSLIYIANYSISNVNSLFRGKQQIMVLFPKLFISYSNKLSFKKKILLYLYIRDPPLKVV